MNNMCDLSSSSQSWGGNGFCQHSFVSHEEGSEDSSDSDEDEYLFRPEKILHTGELYLESERVQIEEASHYVEQFAKLDLHSNMSSDVEPNMNSDHCPMLPQFDKEHSYHDFNLFEFRTNEERNIYRSPILKLNQNQMYFFQRYSHKCEHLMEDYGGFLGLLGRSNTGNREDMSKLADPKESKLMFSFFNIVMNMTDTGKEEFMDYDKLLFDLLDVGSYPSSLKSRVPTNMRKLKTSLTTAKHAILTNFPVPNVFNIGQHACVGLKETFLFAATHGADFNWAYDEKKRNKEGFNGTQAMEDLIEKINNDMIESNLTEVYRINTSIGYLVFWSDTFFRCFIKQIENSI